MLSTEDEWTTEEEIQVGFNTANTHKAFSQTEMSSLFIFSYL